MTVRTRFAPSPTGELHLGNARVAILNWAYARHRGGAFVLRIEDTDPERNVSGAESAIIESLRELGVDWDEGPDVGGPHGPYRQSERLDLYRERAGRLLEARDAFRCYCSREVIEAKREAALARGDNPRYDGTCRDLSPEDEEKRRAENPSPSIRFAVPPGSIAINDVVRGEISFDAGEFGDFVILKSDGLPTYNFAVVVDDHTMEVSHVIRGVGHLTNTARQVMLCRALDIESPIYVHVPHVLAPGGTPLSKRHAARSLRSYLDAGYHPEAIVNYLSLLAWSSPSGDEILPPERLFQEIDLSRIGVANVMFDPDKLEWLSGEYIRRMDPDSLAERLADFDDSGRYPKDPVVRRRVARGVQERINTFRDVGHFLDQFFPPDPMRWSEDAERTIAAEGAPRVLSAVRERLAQLDDWDGELAIQAVRDTGRAIGAKGRSLFMPVRAAVTGHIEGPELADIFAVQGQRTTLRVLGQSLEHVQRSSDSRHDA